MNKKNSEYIPSTKSAAQLTVICFALTFSVFWLLISIFLNDSILFFVINFVFSFFMVGFLLYSIIYKSSFMEKHIIEILGKSVLFSIFFSSIISLIVHFLGENSLFGIYRVLIFSFHFSSKVLIHLISIVIIIIYLISIQKNLNSQNIHSNIKYFRKTYSRENLNFSFKRNKIPFMTLLIIVLSWLVFFNLVSLMGPNENFTEFYIEEFSSDFFSSNNSLNLTVKIRIENNEGDRAMYYLNYTYKIKNEDFLGNNAANISLKVFPKNPIEINDKNVAIHILVMEIVFKNDSELENFIFLLNLTLDEQKPFHRIYFLKFNYYLNHYLSNN